MMEKLTFSQESVSEKFRNHMLKYHTHFLNTGAIYIQVNAFRLKDWYPSKCFTRRTRWCFRILKEAARLNNIVHTGIFPIISW